MGARSTGSCSHSSGGPPAHPLRCLCRGNRGRDRKGPTETPSIRGAQVLLPTDTGRSPPIASPAAELLERGLLPPAQGVNSLDIFSNRLFSNGQPVSPGPVFWRREVRLSGGLVRPKAPLSLVLAASSHAAPWEGLCVPNPPPNLHVVALSGMTLLPPPAGREGEASGETRFVQSEADLPVPPPLRLEAPPLTLARGRGERPGSSSPQTRAPRAAHPAKRPLTGSSGLDKLLKAQINLLLRIR